MIKSIRLQNWKSFADATLRVQPLTVLVGTNASGKSNLFEAFSFLKRFVSGVHLDKIFEDDQNSFPIRGGKNWAIREGESFSFIEVSLQHPFKPDQELLYSISFGKNPASELEVLAEELKLIGKMPSDNVVVFLTERIETGAFSVHCNNNKGGITPIFLNGTVLNLLSKLYLPETVGLTNDLRETLSRLTSLFSRINFIHPAPSVMRGYVSISEELKYDASNTAGVLVSFAKTREDSIYRQLNRHVSLLPDFDLEKVYAEAIKPLEKDAMLLGVEKLNPNDKEGFLVDAQTMSDGTLHFIGILTALLTVPKGSLLIMEEINQGLHPSRAKDLINIIMEIIQEREIDVMFSTHDPALLDAVGLRFSENIQVIYRNEKGESGVKTLRDFSGFAKLMGRGTLGTLSTRGELTEPTFQ